MTRRALDYDVLNGTVTVIVQIEARMGQVVL